MFKEETCYYSSAFPDQNRGVFLTSQSGHSPTLTLNIDGFEVLEFETRCAWNHTPPPLP